MLVMVGSIVGGLVLVAAIALTIVYFVSKQMMAKDQERFEREGEMHMCWISSAGDDLYKIYDVPGAGEARVVFLLSPVSDKNAVLKEITERLTNGKKENNLISPVMVGDFFNKINQQTYLDAPVRMPEWLVGKLEAYTGMMQVYWRKLPKMKLELPFVYGMVIFGEGGGIRHVPYPTSAK